MWDPGHTQASGRIFIFIGSGAACLPGACCHNLEAHLDIITTNKPICTSSVNPPISTPALHPGPSRPPPRAGWGGFGPGSRKVESSAILGSPVAATDCPRRLCSHPTRTLPVPQSIPRVGVFNRQNRPKLAQTRALHAPRQSVHPQIAKFGRLCRPRRGFGAGFRYFVGLLLDHFWAEARPF